MPRMMLMMMFVVASGLATTTAGAQGPSTGDRITATLIVKELGAMGQQSGVDTDDSGDPRVSMTIDGYRWSIYFYDCGGGPRDDRPCASYQFYSAYTAPRRLPLETINKWNTEQRYAKAYTSVLRSGEMSARLEIDVRSEGTGADPAATFRLYFNIMKAKTAQFRDVIGVRR